MTKQEEIREGIYKILKEEYDPRTKESDQTWDILSYLHSKGVVIKNPEYVVEAHERFTDGVPKEIYYLVEPLIDVL